MTDPDIIAERYIAVWNDADEDSRLARLSNDWAADASYVDPMMTGNGRDGIAARINEWMAMMVVDCSRRAVVSFQPTIAQADLTTEASALDLPVAIIPDAELIVYEGVVHGVMVTHASRLAADIARPPASPGRFLQEAI